MPTAIRRIAQQHLRDPEEITVKVKHATADTIRQRFWMVSGLHKLDALTRILEAEPADATIIFVRTKNATVELAEKLEARGYAAAPLNGDIPQAQRERTVGHLKGGKLDIVVATDVAARGLDVERISHVINYDIPYDTEAYVHRIGRTGRAGRQGDAILFVAPREKRLLHAIEKATRSKIELMELPSTESINDQRIARFQQKISDTLATEEIGFFYQLIEQYQQEHNVPAMEIAAALAKLLQGDEPMLLENKPQPRVPRERVERKPRDRSEHADGARRKTREPDVDMERYRIEVGHAHGVKPGNIVGAIANEAGLDSQYIGHIDIRDDYSTVDLPGGMPREVFQDLQTVRVAGQALRISRVAGDEGDRVLKKGAKAGGKPRPKQRAARQKNKGKPDRKAKRTTAAR